MKRIYLDYNSTTPMDPRVLETMLPFYQDEFGNAASLTHSYGWSAQAAVEQARTQVAELIACSPFEVTFTSGSTESNNLVLQGFVRNYHRENPNCEKPHILTSTVEHSCVSETLKYLEAQDLVEVTFLKTNSWGQVTPELVLKAIQPNTILMSFIWGNNEIGSLNPIEKIAPIAKEKGIALHSDATQTVGKIPISSALVPFDFLSFSAHKFYGPKGIGALYCRNNTFARSLTPILFGGGQEKGLRSGTLNVPGIVGFGKACELAKFELEEEKQRQTLLRDQFFSRMSTAFPDLLLNGHPVERLPGHLSLTFPKVRIDRLLPQLQQLALSSTSACASDKHSGSPVLTALGLSLLEQYGTLRIGFGRFTSQDDLLEATQLLVQKIKGSPMVKEF